MSWLPDAPSPPTRPPTSRVEDTEVRGCVGCGGPGCVGCVIPFGTALVLLVSLAVSWWSTPRDGGRAGRAPAVAMAQASPASPAAFRTPPAPSRAASEL